jgi:hypothetical protein
MKALTLIAITCLITLHTFGQIDSDKMLYLQKSEKYKRMRNTGVTLAVGGTVMMVAGLVTIVNNADAYNQSMGQNNADDVGRGALMYFGGAIAIGVGTPLWIVGGINHARYNRKLQSVSSRLTIYPRNRGIGLIYRF